MTTKTIKMIKKNMLSLDPLVENYWSGSKDLILIRLIDEPKYFYENRISKLKVPI